MRKLVQKVSSTRLFAKIAPPFVPALDKLMHRVTKGRVLLSAPLLPGLMLTATGAKSGAPRRTPLACMPQDDGTFLLVGSNWGRPGHPAWTANLIQHPDAEISWKGRDVPVRAEQLAGAERSAAWTALVRFWPPYAAYQARVDRELRLFRLTPR
jgi:deazaflavin-dependent oxidoreductase (nitroreductase family)